MKQIFLFGLFIIFIIPSVVFTVGCANIIPPSGGPRDTLPPVLVSANPNDSNLNFKGSRITLTFDEYIDLQDVQNNLLFTPTFESVPVIEAKLKTISIRLRDSLEANTTYTFNFGNAISDINENNVFRNYVYTFSTGPYLDSLTLSGKVILAQSGTVDSTLTVVLHTDLTDSAVVNKRPRYVSRLDSSGNFTFRNLPPDTFAIYAIGDAGISRRYTSPAQLFAFANEPVIAGNTASINLFAYKEEEDNRNKPTTTASDDKRLKFTTSLSGQQQDLQSPLVITFERPLRTFDSTGIILTSDSTFSPLPGVVTTLDTNRTQLTLQANWQEATPYNLILTKEFATDTMGYQLLKADTVSFMTKSLADYGNLNLRIRNIDTSRNPVLQFVQNNTVVASANIKSGFYRNNLFAPGEYNLRILYDENNNGIWDPGIFFGPDKKQPEIVQPITRTINIKPDWENEFEVTL